MLRSGGGELVANPFEQLLGGNDAIVFGERATFIFNAHEAAVAGVEHQLQGLLVNITTVAELYDTDKSNWFNVENWESLAIVVSSVSASASAVVVVFDADPS